MNDNAKWRAVRLDDLERLDYIRWPGPPGP